jgi:AcrR family transcriptional regulator
MATRKQTPPSRRPLSREIVLRAALALADRDGLAGITARALGERLSVTPMAIYRHVESIAAIEDALLDVVIDDAALEVGRSRSLKEDLADLFLSIHGALSAHPALLPLLGSRGSYGASALTTLDRALARMRSSGLSRERAVSVFHVLIAYVIGAVSLAAAARDRRRDGSGRVDEAIQQTLERGGAPEVAAAAKELVTFASAHRFDSGLRALLSSLLEGAPTPLEKPRAANRRRKAC